MFRLICIHVYVNASFHNISVMDIRFIGRGNQSTRKRKPTGNLQTFYRTIVLNRVDSPDAGNEAITLLVKYSCCIGRCTCNDGLLKITFFLNGPFVAVWIEVSFAYLYSKFVRYFLWDSGDVYSINLLLLQFVSGLRQSLSFYTDVPFSFNNITEIHVC